MDNPNFELDDVEKIRVMRIQCNYCRDEPKKVPALIFQEHMFGRRHAVAIFCQGRDGCDGKSWAFPVDEDSGIVTKHEEFFPLTTNN